MARRKSLKVHAGAALVVATNHLMFGLIVLGIMNIPFMALLIIWAATGFENVPGGLLGLTWTALASAWALYWALPRLRLGNTCLELGGWFGLVTAQGAGLRVLVAAVPPEVWAAVLAGSAVAFYVMLAREQQLFRTTPYNYDMW